MTPVIFKGKPLSDLYKIKNRNIMKRSLYVYLTIALMQLLYFVQIAFAKPQVSYSTRDSLLRIEIQKQLKNKATNSSLYFPLTVKDFYKGNSFKSAWLQTQTEAGPTWQAMLMIDCVLEYGLSHDDYHPKEVNYDKLRDILNKPAEVTISDQARFDILLSDAIITLMNHLHYGKLNPYYSAEKIDKGNIDNFHSDVSLTLAMANTKNYGFLNGVAAVQPRSKEYVALQNRMHVIKGQYDGDCYTVPESEIRKIAINMERLRWANTQEYSYIIVNIPSYTLKLYQADSIYQFRVIVGKPTTPTPTLQSKITHLTTAPDWHAPKRIFAKEILPKAIADTSYLVNNHLAIYSTEGTYMAPTPTNLAIAKANTDKYYARQAAGVQNALGNVVFRFNSAFDIYLHDTSERQLFKKVDRAFSHGCVRVENTIKLAELLLQNDGQENATNDLHIAINMYKKKTFSLNKPVPIKIIYVTCEMKDGTLVMYKDIYNLDKSLEMALYNTGQMLTIH
jgi:hypothetical protein